MGRMANANLDECGPNEGIKCRQNFVDIVNK